MGGPRTPRAARARRGRRPVWTGRRAWVVALGLLGTRLPRPLPDAAHLRERLDADALDDDSRRVVDDTVQPAHVSVRVPATVGKR